MKSIIVTGRGRFEVAESPRPDPGIGEVLIRVKYAALCYRDLLQLRGYYPRMRYPVVLGHEAVGVVEESRDARFRPGDRVVPILHSVDGTCDMCLRGEESYCRSRLSFGEEVDGFFAEYARVTGNSLVKVPDWVSDELAVLTPCVLAMIHKGLRRIGLSVGETVLVTGAGGGVGVHAVQLAKAMGARVVAVTSHEDKAKVLSRFADSVIVGSRFSEEVKRSLGDGVDAVIEAVGTPTINESLRSLRTGGRILLVGNVNPDESYPLRLGYVILKDVAIVSNIAANRSDVASVFNMVKLSKLEPVVAAKYPLHDFGRALEALQSGSRIGKILLVP
ncbi:acryloyl-coenzyme A reductase [Caldivirga sp. UBA161]|uniref:acryloyl-coenzyme A reductase n=1 Tax=Caldivirga sp. UBA161 TaxID=1915569 RepID=UPI0025BA4934|nr:acryloyl-coenzyme A reductase [Caldivirga sp. UBA161]